MAATYAMVNKAAMNTPGCVFDTVMYIWRGVDDLKSTITNREHMSMWKSLHPVWFFVTSWKDPHKVHGILQSIILEWVAFPFSGASSQPKDRTQVSCSWILYQLSHKWSPRTLEWVAYPFSSRSSQPRNLTGVSCIAGRFFTNWAIREALAHSRY